MNSSEKTLYAPNYRKMFFYSTSCPHCHIVKQALRKILLEFYPLPPSLHIEQIDLDLSPSNRQLATVYAKRAGQETYSTPMLVFGTHSGISVVKIGELGDDSVAYENFLRGVLKVDAWLQKIPLTFPKKEA